MIAWGVNAGAQFVCDFGEISCRAEGVVEGLGNLGVPVVGGGGLGCRAYSSAVLSGNCLCLANTIGTTSARCECP